MYLSDVMRTSLLQLQWVMMYLSLLGQPLPKSAGALAIARSRQVNKEDYASKYHLLKKDYKFSKFLAKIFKI